MGTASEDTILSKLKALPGLTSVKKLSTLVGLQPATIYKLVRLGQIPCYRVGYAVRFDPTAIASWLEERAVSK